AATAASTGGTMHMKSESTVHKPGPDVKTKTEAVVGTVKEYEAGKKIKVTGPAGKDVSFDLDKAVTVNGAIAVGQRVNVEYTKSNDREGARHRLVARPARQEVSGRAARRLSAPRGRSSSVAGRRREECSPSWRS
ncbi:MAG TPA: hypothetical protein VK392_09895, partial [Thermoanaerobaculia bacterium]|nr:hypothetical protein [Thermoanaerobaculia bacterium]